MRYIGGSIFFLNLFLTNRHNTVLCNQKMPIESRKIIDLILNYFIKMRQHCRQKLVGCLLLLVVTTTTPLFVFGFNSRSSSSSSSSKSTIMKSNNNNADLSEGAENLFSETPLIRSEPLTALVGKPVYLKLDALQASGSFKVSNYYVKRELHVNW